MCPETIMKQMSKFPFKSETPITEEEFGTITCTDGLRDGSTCSLKCDETFRF